VRRVDDVVGVRVGVVEGPGEARLLPDVVRLGRVDAYRRVVVHHVVVVAGVRGLRGVGVAGGHEAVQIRGRGVVQELRRRGHAARLRQVVVLHVYVNDITNDRIDR